MWTEILDQVLQLQKKARAEGHPIWFRGQRLATWTLKSSIHRRVDWSLETVGKSLPEKDRIELMREVSKSLYHEFRPRAISFLAEHERSDWGVLFTMQHLGLPTRLLDWSQSFATALYFAQDGRKRSDDAAIFVLDPERLNLKTVSRLGIVQLGGAANVRMTVDTRPYHPALVSSENDLETMAVAPDLTNSRMVAQRSTFTLTGASFESIEQRYPECVTKITLPSSDFDEIEAFLNLTGQTRFGLFPDLEGLRDEMIANMNREVEITKQALGTC